MPIYPSQDLGAWTVGDRIFLFDGETLTVGTVLVSYRGRMDYRLGAWKRGALKAFGGKPHRQCDGDQ
jgi:hypothetical protein